MVEPTLARDATSPATETTLNPDPDIGPPDPEPPPSGGGDTRRLLGLITEGEFAAAMGVELRTVQSMRATGKPYPPYGRFGRHIILQVDAVREWLREQAEGVSLEVVHRRPARRPR